MLRPFSAVWIMMVSCVAITLAAEKPALKGPPKNATPIPLKTLSFDKDPIGKPPSAWTFTVMGEGTEVHWEIQQDPLISTIHHILAQTGHTEPGNNVALALLNAPLYEHGEVAVRFRIINGESDQSAGIVWRYKDPQNFYMIRASAKDDDCSVYLVKKGKMKQLDSQQAIILPYGWHELRLIFVEKNYTVFVDHRLVVGGKNSGLSDAGQIGLCTFSDSVVRFDTLQVSQ